MPLSEEITKIISTTIENRSRGLDLEYYNIRASNVEDLVEELKKMPNLTSLNLAWNDIGKEGATVLAEELKQILLAISFCLFLLILLLLLFHIISYICI